MKKRKKVFRSILAGVLLLFIASIPVKADEMELYAQSAVLMDADTGRILFGKKENEVRAMASTTKIMTCILVLENTDLSDTAVASGNAAIQPKVHLGVYEGETFYVKDLLCSLMLESHNDAAVILAEKTAGSVEAFAEEMNQKAAELGCTDTHFVTPNGLDGEDAGGEHRTTAVDMAKILSYCIKRSPKRAEFLEITRTKTWEFSDVEQKSHYRCYNHNAFLDMMEGALTGKTGFTGKAGYCYVGALESEGRTFVVALLGCGWPNNRGYKWVDMRKLMTYGMEHFQIQEFSMDVPMPELSITNGIPKSGKLWDACTVPTKTGEEPKRKIQLLVSDEDQVKLVCNMKTKLDAPVREGTKVGKLTLWLNDRKIKEQEIVAEKGVQRISLRWCAGKVVKNLFNF